MKRMIFPILLAALIFTLGFALADTEKIVVSPTFTEYLYTDIHQTEAGFTFVDASVGQYIQDSKYGDMLVASASISVDYDQVERNPVLFWNLYINGEESCSLLEPVYQWGETGRSAHIQGTSKCRFQSKGRQLLRRYFL